MHNSHFHFGFLLPFWWFHDINGAFPSTYRCFFRCHFAPHESRPLEIYVDSNWAVKFSASGALFFFNGCLVHWFSKTQRSVAFSSAESEMFGAILAAKEGIVLRELLSALGIKVSEATRMYSDNKACIDLSYDPVAFKKTKHILRAAYGLRDYVARRVFSMSHVNGAINMADIMTKNQAVAIFNQLMSTYDAYTNPTVTGVPASE